MYYDKRIRYIDYLENGEKRCNCGYVKMTVTDGSLLMDMQIRGLYETDDVASEVMLEGAGTECRIGTVMIRQGSGSLRWEFRDPAHAGEEIVINEGLRYGQLKRIAVQLSPRRSLRCIWREAEPAKAVVSEEPPESAAEAVMSKELPESAAETVLTEELPESVAEAAISEESLESVTEAVMPEELPESIAGTAMLEESPESVAGTAMPQKSPESVTEAVMSKELPESMAGAAMTEEMPESVIEAVMEEGLSESAAAAVTPEELPESEAETVTLQELPESMAEEEPEMHEESGGHPQEELHTAENQKQSIQEPRAAVLCEDKWRQLQMIYPHIYPFQDEREYLSLRPEDFVILSSNAYRLVRNSFLLHGYYNYEHLILTNVSYKGVSQYYIGVPGNFYEKEKQVAIMYGFNSFECKREPAEEGDFGYYMIRVEL